MAEPPSAKRAKASEDGDRADSAAEKDADPAPVESDTAVSGKGTAVSGKEGGDSAPRGLPSLETFALDRVLSVNPRAKAITVTGHFPGSDEAAVILAEKQPIAEQDLPGLFSRETKLSQSFQNDVYGQHVAMCHAPLGGLRLMTVYPATDAHIRKYSARTMRVLHESPEDYRQITRPFVEREALKLEWVYNILDGRKEKDRVVYSDTDPSIGFVLLPDMKWDLQDMESMYLLAIARRPVLSLRELKGEHLPLLRNILTKGKEAIMKSYGIPSNQIRAYLHYQPSYYHLHVHFTHIKYDAPRTLIGQAHLLDDVIDNCENIDPLYYHKKTLTCIVMETSPLWREYEQRNKLVD